MTIEGLAERNIGQPVGTCAGGVRVTVQFIRGIGAIVPAVTDRLFGNIRKSVLTIEAGARRAVLLVGAVGAIDLAVAYLVETNFELSAIAFKGVLVPAGVSADFKITGRHAIAYK